MSREKWEVTLSEGCVIIPNETRPTTDPSERLCPRPIMVLVFLRKGYLDGELKRLSESGRIERTINIYTDAGYIEGQVFVSDQFIND